MVSGPVSFPYAVFHLEDWSPAYVVPAQGLGPCASPCPSSVQVQGELFELLLSEQAGFAAAAHADHSHRLARQPGPPDIPGRDSRQGPLDGIDQLLLQQPVHRQTTPQLSS